MPTYILYGDETNTRPEAGAEFFIYGGAWLSLDRLPELNRSITDIRREHGYQPTDLLKFNTRSRPSHVTPNSHTAAKRDVLSACWDAGLLFAAECVLHEIMGAAPGHVACQVDPVLLAFDRFLVEKDAHGLVVLDRTSDEKAMTYARDRFQQGVVMATTGTQLSALDRIDMIAVSAIGASHLASAVDVVLGSFRYCVNDAKQSAATRAMLPAVVSLMWHTRSGSDISVRDRGLLLRPRDVKYAPYRKRYGALTARLTDVMSSIDDWRGPHPEAG